MDEDTAMWKERVRVISFMEAQKGKKILFEKLFSRNKKINKYINRGRRKSVLNCIWNQILSETNRRK